MADPDLFADACMLIRNHFPVENYSGEEEFRKGLSHAVCELLVHDYQKLLNLAYRIDVDEKKFQSAFTAGSSSEISERITDLLIERALQKAELRKKYRP
ncbi:MAG: hypothetical protein ACJ75J_02460 [Cytophagaceae bacterium]